SVMYVACFCPTLGLISSFLHPRPRTSSLFPYTTLFRSVVSPGEYPAVVAECQRVVGPGGDLDDVRIERSGGDRHLIAPGGGSLRTGEAGGGARPEQEGRHRRAHESDETSKAPVSNASHDAPFLPRCT